ncbi:MULTISPECIES: hypothetical protein [Brasilonema]|uniref:Uncharacterized protein n=2 Tax=Brasilonema TaxID=383614 RepID=A0A856MLZ8_9CYAN|nr:MULTISPECIES: hypothetical protein [Brasilonema]NMF63888.1 hypothetical protein [Brasilonema octagenarum UFV-OR1]QDL09956.1 hypothetical protein DP114_20535 [Brasilonema sennae CENA114]
MNPLFTEIAASQATSVVGGYAKSTDSTSYSNQATLGGTVAASTEVDNGTYSTDINGTVEADDQKTTSSLNISAVISY